MSELKMPLRSDAANAILIVIDMQEKLVPAMHETYNLIHHTGMLIQGCVFLGLPVLFTQQYTKGLGGTIPQIKDEYRSAAMSADGNVRLAVEDQIVIPRKEIEFSYVEKTSFSVMDEPAFADTLENTGRRDVILCGIEAHVCVMQSALDLVARGNHVSVVTDATASRRAPDAEYAYSRMAQAGVTITTMEAILFDLLKDSKHPMFRQISALVK
ncbi:MAG: isochorismatase family protein [Clostridiales Family XIII bacterium]|nr:isochorismatase family protein [Clostridiales Family XIII bacterium]